MEHVYGIFLCFLICLSIWVFCKSMDRLVAIWKAPTKPESGGGDE
jgi:hypothetical protein